ncbi:Hypothetical predicted protein [Octopus vulgaris]|uniref:Uncharacterized protein n=1 Tax=Octopus vulgaris TaxID=6645 RepID=A0AA36B2V7_OCTVU|nr:Hypothetical predicted protein [Octopus vulgaris]
MTRFSSNSLTPFWTAGRQAPQSEGRHLLWNRRVGLKQFHHNDIIGNILCGAAIKYTELHTSIVVPAIAVVDVVVLLVVECVEIKYTCDLGKRSIFVMTSLRLLLMLILNVVTACLGSPWEDGGGQGNERFTAIGYIACFFDLQIIVLAVATVVLAIVLDVVAFDTADIFNCYYACNIA